MAIKKTGLVGILGLALLAGCSSQNKSASCDKPHKCTPAASAVSKSAYHERVLNKEEAKEVFADYFDHQRTVFYPNNDVPMAGAFVLGTDNTYRTNGPDFFKGTQGGGIILSYGEPTPTVKKFFGVWQNVFNDKAYVIQPDTRSGIIHQLDQYTK